MTAVMTSNVIRFFRFTFVCCSVLLLTGIAFGQGAATGDLTALIDAGDVYSTDERSPGRR